MKYKETTLAKITRLYDIVAEMNKISDELGPIDIEVRVCGKSNRNDPLGQMASLQITLGTKFNYLL